MIENFVFKGGGVKGTAYVGAIQCFDLVPIKRVAGTSAGSIIAGLIATGYTSTEIKDIVFSIDYNKFKDGWWPFRILSKYGFYKGDYFLKWIENLIVKKLGKPNATFRDFAFSGKKELTCIATSNRFQNRVLLNLANTPDFPVSLAIRASMSIPGFFDGVQIQSDILTDGGEVYNYPIDIYDQPGQINEKTLGFSLWDYQETTPEPFEYYEFLDFLKTRLQIAINQQFIQEKRELPVNDFRSIRIDDFGIKATDFNISYSQKQQLFDSGIDYAKKYLTTQKGA